MKRKTTKHELVKRPPGRKDVEEPLKLLASCRDPRSKVTTLKPRKQKKK